MMLRVASGILVVLALIAALRFAGLVGDAVVYGVVGGLACSALIVAADRLHRQAARRDDDGH